MNRQPATPYSLAWYQQVDEQQAGKAYVTITVDQDPVKGVLDPNRSDVPLWLFTLSMTEHNGIDFTVTEIFFQELNGTAPKGSGVMSHWKRAEAHCPSSFSCVHGCL